MTDLTVANEILRQLGGTRFRVMTGARNFAGDASGLRFQLPPCDGVCKHSRICIIVLDPSDTYTVTVRGYRGLQMIGEPQVASDVYCDTLQETFTRLTGLYTRF